MKLNDDSKQKLILFILGSAVVSIMVWIVINHESIENSFLKMFETTKPFLYGISFAYILSPLCDSIEAKLIKNGYKHHNVLSTAITELILLLIIIIVCIIIIPQSIKSITNIIQSAPSALQSTQTLLDNQLKTTKILHDIFGDAGLSIIETAEKFTNNTIIPNIDSISSSLLESATRFGKLILNIVLGIIISIFALLNRRKFTRQLKLLTLAIFSKKVSSIIFEKASYANKVFSNFFIGKTVDSIIIGLLCFISLSILRMPYTVLISVIVAITNMIPFAGPFIGAIPSFIIVLSESSIKSIYFLIFIIILQQIDGHIIGPKCIGNATGLNTFWVLFSIIFFGGMFGIAGMFIGVPMFAVIYGIVKDIVYNLLKKRNISKEDIKDE
jgi:putative membrane protein